MELTDIQQDTIKELINIGVGKAADILNHMLQAHITLNVPVITVLSSTEKKEMLTERIRFDELVAIQLGFVGSLSGSSFLIFPPESAKKLISVITSEIDDNADLDEIRIGTLKEMGNIILNGVMGSFGNIIKEHIGYYIPNYLHDLDTLLSKFPDEDSLIILAETFFTIQKHEIEGDILLLFDMDGSHNLILSIDQLAY